MERHEAWALFISTRDLVMPLFDAIADTDNKYQAIVIALDTALDHLHDAASQLSTADQDDAFEDMGTPLFDARSYVAQARSLCRGNGVRVHVLVKIRELIEHARESLEDAVLAELPY